MSGFEAQEGFDVSEGFKADLKMNGARNVGGLWELKAALG